MCKIHSVHQDQITGPCRGGGDNSTFLRPRVERRVHFLSGGTTPAGGPLDGPARVPEWHRGKEREGLAGREGLLRHSCECVFPC